MKHCLLPILILCGSLFTNAAQRPNIVVLLADDMGTGDVSCLNPAGKIQTPHLDRLAKEGVVFTDAHSGSSVCTPTRYGLLTGRYSWRSRMQQGVLGGLSPRLIEQDRETMASLFKAAGYHTACIGKWHLGMDWAIPEKGETPPSTIEKPEQVWSVDFSKPITNGPNAVGFDYFFGISASLDMVPYTFITNDRAKIVPTFDGDFPWFLGRERRTRRGPTAEGFDAADVLPEITRESVAFIRERATDAKNGKPFFLYVPYASPHTPVLPTPAWRGKSGINFYADFVMENDDSVGQIMRALEESGLADNTLIIFTTDNGCSPEADFKELAAAGHDPNAGLRGHKADIYEGGHRVPFIVRWPARVPAGRTSTQLVCLNDIMATAAEAAGIPVADPVAEDSFSFLPALTGESSDKPVRSSIVHHSVNGSFAVREGPWKLILCPGSGGWSAPRPGQYKGLPPLQLYNLEEDLAERNNLHERHPEIVARLTALLEKIANDGRSTPGTPQKNAVEINLWKGRKS